MSIRAMQAVLEHSNAKGSNLLVLLLIANVAPDDGTYAWIPQKTLCRYSRMSERAIRLILGKLEDDGELLIIQNDERIVPDRAKFAPSCFYTIQCMQPSEPTGTENDRQTLPAKIAGGRPAKIAAAGGKDYRRKPAKIAGAYIEEGSVQDPFIGSVPQTPAADAAAADAAAVDEIDFSDLLSFTADDVLGLYNEILADATLARPLPKCLGLTSKLRTHIRARLREQNDAAWWRQLFTAAAESTLTDGSWSFRPGIEWFVKNDENARKVLAGNYQRTTMARPTAGPKRLSMDVPPYDPEQAEARFQAQKKREEAAKQREAEAEAAIAAMPLVARDALMVAASEELATMGVTLKGDDYRKAVERNMVLMIVEGSRGRTVADAVAYFVSQHGGAACA